MINEKKIIAIIPARGGSKGLPNKNIKMMNGKPLIQWTIETALNTPEIDTVLVSTDCKEIQNISIKSGAESPFLRPKILSSDTASTFDAVKHSLDFYSATLKKNFDIVVLLEPTSPLREKNDISNMLTTLCEIYSDFDAIVSLGEVSEHPSIVKEIVNDKVQSFIEDSDLSIRRQDCTSVYFPYGIAYIIKAKTLLAEKTFYPIKTSSFKIKRHQCFEIDDIYDFLAVENIMKYEWNLK